MIRRVALVALVLLAGCGGGGSKEGEGTTAGSTGGGTVTVGTGCGPVPAAVVRRIQRGIVLVGAKLVRPRAVRASVGGYYFVSARVPAIDPGAVATWATKGIDPATQIIAVDPNAREISEFGSGSSHDPPLTEDTGGAQESRDCATRGAG